MIKKAGLTKLEEDVLTHMLAGDQPIFGEIQCQIENSEITDRHFSGTGFFVDFKPCEKIRPIDGCPTIHLSDVVATMDGLERGAGFALHIVGGKVTFLEGFSFSEKWPSNPVRFSIEYTGGENRDVDWLRRELGRYFQ